MERAERTSLTFRKELLRDIDAAAEKLHMSRSGLVTLCCRKVLADASFFSAFDLSTEANAEKHEEGVT